MIRSGCEPALDRIAEADRGPTGQDEISTRNDRATPPGCCDAVHKLVQSTAGHPCRVVVLARMYNQCTIGDIGQAQACCDDRFRRGSISVHLKIRQGAQMTGEGCTAQLSDSRQPQVSTRGQARNGYAVL